MKKIWYMLLIAATILLASQAAALADSTSEALEAQYQIEMKNMYGKDFNPPFAYAQDNTGVDTDNGALRLKENLLTLPGKNGLDLRIDADYLSSRNGFRVINRNTNYARMEKYLYTYYYYTSDGRKINFYLFCPLESQVQDVYFSNYTYLGQSGAHTPDGTYYKTLGNGFRTNSQTGWDVPAYLDKTVPMIRKVYRDYDVYELVPESDSIGFNIKTPHLEVQEATRLASGSLERYTGLFHDETGQTHQFNFTIDFLDYPNLIRYQVTEFYIDDPKGRVWTMTEAHASNAAANHTAGFTYNLAFQSDEGITYYLNFTRGSATCNIAAVEDRYGNRIIYNLDSSGDGEIIDTYGRHIKIDTVTDDNVKNKTISLMENGVEKPMVSICMDRVNNAVVDPYDILTTDDEHVVTIIRRESEDGVLQSSPNVTRYSAVKNQWDCTSLANFNYTLAAIEYPTGAQRCYTFYSTLGMYDQEVFRVSRVYDQENGETKNDTSYQYTKKTLSASYPGHYNSSYTTTVTHVGGGADKYIYDGYERLKQTQNFSTGEITDYIYEDEPVSTSTNVQTVARRSYIRTRSNLNGDTEYSYWRGRQESSHGSQTGQTSTSYDYQRYFLPVSQSQRRDSGHETVTENTLSEDGKSIVSSTVSENGEAQSVTYYQYDQYGNITQQRVTDAAGTELSKVDYTYTYNADGSYTVVSTARGVKDADGGTLADVVTSAAYDMRGRKVSETDGRGNTTSYAYDALNRLLSQTNPDNTSVAYAYDTANNTITVTNPNGSQEKHSYTKLGLYDNVQVKQNGAWQTVYSYAYDSMSRKTGETEYRGSGDTYSAAYTLDTRGRVTNQTITDAAGSVVGATDYSYDTEGAEEYSLLDMAMASGSAGATVDTSNDRLQLSGGSSSSPAKAIYALNGEYDQFSMQINGADWPLDICIYGDDKLLFYGDVYTRGYYKTINVSGVEELRIETTDEAAVYLTNPTLYKQPPLLDKVTITPQGDAGEATPRIERYQNPGGRVYRESVYESGTNELLYTTENKYDMAGNLVETTTADRTSKFEYNYQNQQVRATTPANTSTQAAYDALGRKVSGTDYMGNTTTYTYDSLGRQIQINSPFEAGVSAVTKNYYDASGNVVKTLVQDNAPGEGVHFKKQEYAYDAMNRVTVATAYADDSTPSVTQYSYDALGNPTAVYTGLSAPLDLSAPTGDYAVTRYEYNDLGQLVKETDALGQPVTYVNDLTGQVKQKTDRNGNTTAYTYNVRGDLLTQSVTKDGETQTLQNTYSKAGLLKQTVDNEGTTNYTYNALGRLTKEEKGNIINTYEYDVYGNRTGYTLANAGGQVLQNSYTYDKLNQLTGVTNGTETTAYTYDSNGNVLYERTGTTRHIYYTYNAAGLLTDKENVVGGNTVQETGYSYNLDGNIRQEAELDGSATTYAYDGMGRLTGETCNNVTTTYSYDAYSNRAVKTVGSGGSAVTTSYTYDKNNRLLREHETVEGVAVSSIYTYDANGNQLGKTVHSSTNAVGDETQLHLGAPVAAGAEVVLNRYDGLNRLISTERSKDGETVKASYTYNAAGIRTSKTVNGITTQHLLDGVNVVADVTNGQTTSFVRGLGLISMNAGGTTGYYVTDGHGDVRALANASGTVTKRYEYDAFGVEKGEDAADTNPFRYCGEYYDAETGSVYLRARYYDPRVGRFGAEDPARDGLNWYVYCAGNPVNFWDPMGLAPTVMEAAYMADHVYYHDWDEDIKNRRIFIDGKYTGWRMIDQYTYGSLKIGVYVRGDGLDPLSNYNGPLEYTLSYKGTQPTSGEDWANNAQQYLGDYSEHFVQGTSYTSWFLREKGQYEVTFVGHSKGGGEAAINAELFGRNAIVFNPSIPWMSSQLKDRGYVKAYVVEEEILNYYLGEQPLGQTYYLKKQHDGWLPGISITDRINNHTMDSVIKALKEGGYR